MKPLFRALMAAALLMAVVTAGLTVWAMYFEVPFLSYENLPFPANLEQVRIGEVIPLTVKRCSTADDVRAYAITHELRSVSGDALPVVMSSQLITANPGCETSTSQINRVPDSTPPGRYRVFGMAILEGTLHPWTVPWSSQPFEVVAP